MSPKPRSIGLCLAVAWSVAISLQCEKKSAAPAPNTAAVPEPAAGGKTRDWSALASRSWHAEEPAKAQTSGAYVWWEAEKTSSTDFPARNPFAPASAKEAEVLSEGTWIGAENPGKRHFAEYEVEVVKSSAYNLYVRKFWRHGPFRWRFDDAAWNESGRDVALLDEEGLRKFVVANWVHLGKVELGQGKHLFRIELTEDSGASSFDAFLLVERMFVPRGKLKPGKRRDQAPPGWFAFDPDPDAFTQSAIDLRELNEKSAGDQGFIVVKGDSFRHRKSGKPLRFWAINTGHDALHLPDDALDYFARRLAKAGVNMVRVHGGLWQDDDFEKIDPKKLARLHYFIAAMKKQGVYIELSIYFPLWMKLEEKHGYEGYEGEHPFALPYFSGKFQRMYQGWWRQIMTSRNPHTGLALSDEPAIAIAELVNEDGMMFWTFDAKNVPAPQMEIVEKQFGDFVKKKHGSLDAALRKWGGKPHEKDGFAKGRVALVPLWEIFSKKDQRAQDTAQFLMLLEKSFYQKMVAYLKKDLGYKSTIVCSNWITANAEILGPLDKYANTVCDVMDRHGYYGGPHHGEGAGYSLAKGQKYDDAAAVLFESSEKNEPDKPKTAFSLPIMDLAYNGKPSILSEVNWPPPNRFRADFPVLTSAYGALQGSDGQFFFATAAPVWSRLIGKFTISDPVIMGQFPATARIFRQGLVKTADPVAQIELDLSDLLALKGAPVSAPLNLDLFRKQHILPGKTARAQHIETLDPLAFFVGRVEMNVSEAHNKSSLVNMAEFIDRNQSRVKSVTSELSWDFARGLVTIDAPSAQGATGFLSKAGPIDLGAITIDTGIDYGSVLAVSLDEKSLAESDRLLVQVMSEQSNYGWQTEPRQGFREITDVGVPPIVVRTFSGGIVLKRGDASSLSATALDPNGYPVRRSRDLGQGLALLPDALYYVVERR